ncbi:membrane-bound metal-dependent hydrolase [Haloterrigena salina JCM 13891]|uniref:Membrane-bound metal-dependent hydrolase n=1 Tax=Haloterrigena salina JCM 13891 TaxID=1227488 RepID=M0C235_9EURY|nr:metal-dependent hydrolase [Haloterrigena salina]ELZ17270.1 membrane-bound metal-dependent hydrolase [Haloterrigena salina JCM 13891]
MYQVGHYGTALLAYAPLGTAVALAGHETAALLGALACVALSTLPDCDQKVPLVEHRGPTHSLVFALLVGAGLAGIAATFAGSGSPLLGAGLVGFAFLVGALSICSHLFADALTPMGIRPLWPLSSRRYTLAVTRTANPLANYVLLGLGVAAVLVGAGIVATLG